MRFNKTLIIGIIISIVILLMVQEIIYLSKETTFQIRKFDISKSDNSIVNITLVELSKYPALEGAIGHANKTTEYYSQYKVSTDDWTKIRDFMNSKFPNYGDVSPCIKFGERYGETCYQLIFIRQG